MIAQPLIEDPLDVTLDERWEAVQRIVQSGMFERSPRLCRLLLFLAEQSLLDHSRLLTEHNIAARVFERSTGFDPGVDTIVRSHMVRLRQKLDQYAEEFSPADYRVSVPRGEYRVRFERASNAISVAQPLIAPQDAVVSRMLDDHVAAATPALLPRAIHWLALVLGLCVLMLGAALVRVRVHSVTAPVAALPPHPLWDRMFQPERKTTLVSADSGLVLLQRLTGKRATLAEYLKRDFNQQTRGLPQARENEILDLVNRRYTSFVDLNLYRKIDHLPYAASGHLEVKYARDVNINDLKQGNVVISGSAEANPWLDLYAPEMNFVGENDPYRRNYRLRNRKPLPGEPNEYDTTPGDPGKRVLGVLAFLSNLDGDGNALIVEGNNMAGTEAISDFLFDDKKLLPFLHEIRGKDGTVPHFEVVIESTSVNGSAGPVRIVAYRTHP